LFSDLEGQLESARSREFEAGVREMAEAERATVDLAARLLASRGDRVSLALRNGERVSGVVVDASGAWVLLDDDPRQHLVPHAAIAVARGVSHRAAELGEVERRLGLGHALRALAREGAEVVVASTGASVWGRIRHVGADHLDVESDDVGSSAIPFRELLLVTSTGASL
jgi:sRNA-binding regulator protein Hfq